MAALRIHLLGGLDVEGVEHATLGSRKARRLLARLAVARGGVVSTDALAEDLWGPTQPSHPREDLSVLVSRLRSRLPAGELARRDAGYALTGAWLDLAAVEEERRRASEHAAHGRWREAAEAARAALSRVRGPVVPELADAEWVVAEQVALDHGCQQAQVLLARAELAVGDPRVAADLAQEVLSASPYDEVALRLHLEACLAAHAPSLGLATYAAARTRLADELGVDPSPETVALHERLLLATRAPARPPSGVTPVHPAPRPVAVDGGGERPETHYVRTADGLYIAYQVTGAGPIDLVFNVGLLSHVEAAWDIPGKARFFRRLASFCRLIRFDKRGSGLSDPVAGPTTLEERMEDMRAVLDAIGSRRAALLGISEGGSMSVLFAAQYPERTSALVLYGTGARGSRAPDYPYGLDPSDAESVLEQAVSAWGTPDDILIQLLAPRVAADPQVRQAFAAYERLAASPGQFAATTRMNIESDVRAVLPMVQTPTLVLHREDDLLFEAGHGRYLAENIPGATLRLLPGGDHMFWVDPDQIVDEVEEFLLGARRAREPDRVLSTILMTHVPGSAHPAPPTDAAGQPGADEPLDLRVPHQLGPFGGRVLRATRDGVVAAFDGPARAVRCAQSIVAEARGTGLRSCAAVHTGECEVRDDGLAGVAMDIAAGVRALARDGEVLASSTVKDLVAGSGIRFAGRGELVLAAGEDPLRVYAVLED